MSVAQFLQGPRTEVYGVFSTRFYIQLQEETKGNNAL